MLTNRLKLMCWVYQPLYQVAFIFALSSFFDLFSSPLRFKDSHITEFMQLSQTTSRRQSRKLRLQVMSPWISVVWQVFWAVHPWLRNSSCMLTPIPWQQKSQVFLPLALLCKAVCANHFFLLTLSYCISAVKVVTAKIQNTNALRVLLWRNLL